MASFTFTLGDVGGENALEFIIEDEDDGSTDTSENVRESTLEKCLWSFLLGDLDEAINGTSIKNISSSGLHH